MNGLKRARSSGSFCSAFTANTFSPTALFTCVSALHDAIDRFNQYRNHCQR